MKSRVSRAIVAGAASLVLLAAVIPAHAEWNKGLEAYKAKDWATAVKEFEEVTKTNPDYAGAYYMLGVSQRALGQLSPAVASLRKAVELDGAQSSYKIALGQALLQADQFQKAYELLKPLSISSVDAANRTNYALLFAQAATKTNRPTESISVLNAQAKADPKNAGLQQALGAAYNANGDDAQAFAAFSKAFELNSNDQSSGRNAVRAGIGAARRANSDSQKSQLYTSTAQVADRLANGFPTFDHQLLAGESWLGAKNYAKAQSWFDKAKVQQPNNALVYFYLAQCKTSTGQLNDAISDLQQAIKFKPADKVRTQIYNQGGYVYDKMKKYDQAAQWYSNAGNTSMANQMREKQNAAAQNKAADQECAEFKRTIDGLRLQAAELEKIGDLEGGKQVREQLPTLEKDYTDKCR
ncbi:MAG: tetratricopeptide repeat protein [Thermoanaerobaculales bacterium]|nr:tetratricopeptide repeat protein [Thermoanaerobaculales bacterium]